MAGHFPGLLQDVLASIPEGFLVDSKWLNARGVSRQLLHQYVQNGWFIRVGHGLVRKPSSLPAEETGPDWIVPLLSAQWMGYDVHAGGTTALELLGHVHYLSLGGKPIAYLYSSTPPSWLKQLNLQTELKLRKPTLFADEHLGVETVAGERFSGGYPVNPWSFQLTLSAPERAILEALDELPLNEGFGALDGVFENLSGLRPDLLNRLLRQCTSVKVKRLFFVFADRHDHGWRRYLDDSEYNLGSGDRQFVKNGRLHPRYRITVPPEFMPATGGAGDDA